MMKLTLLALLCVVVAVSASTQIPEESRLLFSNWAREHGRTYASPVESEKRLQIFHNNLQFINQHNALAAQGLKTYTVGANVFADLTVEEYRAQYLTYRPSFTTTNANRTNVHRTISDIALPASVDWRTKQAVTPVKDQGQCGSCWSFSSTGAMEGAHAIKTGSLVSLSEQNLVDCVKGGTYTCDTGGEMQDAFQYVIDNGGIDTEDSYPYCTCSGNQCQYNAANSAATFSSYKVITQGSETDLQSAAVIGPVSIAIDASQQSFQLYTSGVYYEPACSTTQLDHGVLIAGYGVDSGKDFWLVKNSWSASWGMQGYIQMSRNRNNNCGVATDASYPIV
jgi:cathepsin L